MNERKNTVHVEIGEIENSCFVVMPFDSLFQTQYERVIRPAVEEFGLKCIRGDEIYSKPQIMSDIWNSIRRSRLMIAELTNRNANVFYEVGLAHAIGKPIILLTRNEGDVPFDLQSLRYSSYNVNDPFWGETLRAAIKSMMQSILEQPEIPVYLEGIKAEIEFPQMPDKNSLIPKRLAVAIDVSGSWKLDMRGDDLAYHGIMFITQHGEELSATLTLTFEEADAKTVIQEVLLGTIQGEKVTLNGIFYEYIVQGNTKGYQLDNFHLLLSPDRHRMAGGFASFGDNGNVTLVKQEGVS
jgi:hypothetical protein